MYSHFGQNNHAVEYCFALHLEKTSIFHARKALETKLEALEERFKNLASSGQILESPIPPEAKVSLSTPD